MVQRQGNHVLKEATITGKNMLSIVLLLTLKVPITTAVDDKFCEILPNFRKK